MRIPLQMLSMMIGSSMLGRPDSSRCSNSCPAWDAACFKGCPSFCRSFFRWYNAEHRHGGISMLTPEQVHFGNADQVIAGHCSLINPVECPIVVDRFRSANSTSTPLRT